MDIYLIDKIICIWIWDHGDNGQKDGNYWWSMMMWLYQYGLINKQWLIKFSGYFLYG